MNTPKQELKPFIRFALIAAVFWPLHASAIPDVKAYSGPFEAGAGSTIQFHIWTGLPQTANTFHWNINQIGSDGRICHPLGSPDPTAQVCFNDDLVINELSDSDVATQPIGFDFGFSGDPVNDGDSFTPSGGASTGTATFTNLDYSVQSPSSIALNELGFFDLTGTTVTLDSGTLTYSFEDGGSPVAGIHDFSTNPIATTVDALTFGTWDSVNESLSATFTANNLAFDLGGVPTQLMIDVTLLDAHVTSVVPIPAAVWLFGTGLVTLFGTTTLGKRSVRIAT